MKDNVSYLKKKRNALMYSLEQAASNCSALGCENCDLMVNDYNGRPMCAADNPVYIMNRINRLVSIENVKSYNEVKDELDNLSVDELRELVYKLCLEHDTLVDIIVSNNLDINEEFAKQAHREFNEMILLFEGNENQ